ncbi:MAG: DNA polymerase IV [bacterium]
MRQKLVLHLDMDAFFASVEQLVNPYLKGQPVIVSGDPDGRSVVSTCSYEARPFGVRSGMPVREALRRCPQAIIVQGNPQKYIHISAEIFRILQQYTPFVEPFSIDEAFLELRDGSTWDEASRMAEAIKMKIRQTFHISCSVGIAENKLLAKMASDLEKPNGLTVLKPSDIAPLFQRLPIRQLWGVGEKGETAMKQIGVKTISDLKRFSREELVYYFGAAGYYYYNACRGHDDTLFVYFFEDPDVKSMGNEYTLYRDSRDTVRLIGILRFLSQKVSRRLRKDGWKGRTITVKIRFQGFRTITRAKTWKREYDSEEVIYREARELFLNNWDGKESVRLLGVSISHLKRKPEWEQMLFLTDHNLYRKDRITSAKDRVQDIYGEESITWGSILASEMNGA